MTTATRDKVREAYSGDAEGYDRIRLEEPRGRMLSEYDQALFNALLPDPVAGARTLEVGSGTGRFTVEALARGYTLTATDVNESMLARLRERVAEAGYADRCTLEPQDAFNLTYESGSFDLVYALHMVPRFLTVEDQTAAIRSLARVVRPGGRLLFNYRNSRSPYNLAYRGPAIRPAQVRRALEESNMRIEMVRGKWILNKRLIMALPMPLARAAASVDRALLGFWPAGAWDVFVVAVKQQ